jgi:hypothetical protein
MIILMPFLPSATWRSRLCRVQLGDPNNIRDKTMKRVKNMHYVSDLDKFSKEFDRTHPLSESQKAEIEKHQRIYKLRDIAIEKAEDGGEQSD